jgi:hypothetical protein
MSMGDMEGFDQATAAKVRAAIKASPRDTDKTAAHT